MCPRDASCDPGTQECSQVRGVGDEKRLRLEVHYNPDHPDRPKHPHIQRNKHPAMGEAGESETWTGGRPYTRNATRDLGSQERQEAPPPVSCQGAQPCDTLTAGFLAAGG